MTECFAGSDDAAVQTTDALSDLSTDDDVSL